LGNHSLAVDVGGVVWGPAARTLFFANSTSTTFFAIDTQPTPTATPIAEPFPASLVFVASVGIALAVIGLFVYFKKRQRDKNP
jgi:hypothetical protein